MNDASEDRIWTIPNGLCAIRLGGAPILVGLALAGHPRVFLWLFLALAVTDWVDGKLAIYLNQRSVFGARLDSFADAALYLALLFGALWLKWDVLGGELGWLVSTVLSYAVSTLAGVAKFGRWPSYHTRAAKTSWLLASVAVLAVFSGWSVWPLRLACAAVVITNLEATLITVALRQWRANVPSLYSVWKAGDGRRLL